VSAQKKGKGSGRTTVAATGTLVLDQAQPALGDVVTFSWSAVGLPSNVTESDLRIQIEAYAGDHLVWGQTDFADDQTFTLLAHDMTTWGWPEITGDVTCVAKLYYWTWEKVQGVDQQVFHELAGLAFVAAPGTAR
jgi:hypothetical protein